MNTAEKLLKAFEHFRPHINGHKTAMDLFFEAVKEVEDLQKQVKNCSIPDVSQRSELLAFAKEMQDIGFNEMDEAEKVVDIYIKANCG